MGRLKTRKPTGRAPWPFVLVEGPEKSGKSWAWATLSVSPRVGDTVVFIVGESDGDAYGALPGARYLLAEHDGTYRAILDQVDAAVTELAHDAQGRPPVIVFDSLSNLWELLKNEAQATANARARQRRRFNGEDVPISMDLWNAAARKWRAILDRLMGFNGIVVGTARGKEVTELDDNDKPSKEKSWRVEGQKHLTFDVDVWVRTQSGSRDALLVGARSVKAGISPDQSQTLEAFTLEALVFDVLGAGEAPGERSYAPLREAIDADDMGPPAADWQEQHRRFTALTAGPLHQPFLKAVKTMLAVNSIRDVRAANLETICDRLERNTDRATAMRKMIEKYAPGELPPEAAEPTPHDELRRLLYDTVVESEAKKFMAAVARQDGVTFFDDLPVASVRRWLTGIRGMAAKPLEGTSPGTASPRAQFIMETSRSQKLGTNQKSA